MTQNSQYDFVEMSMFHKFWDSDRVRRNVGEH